MHELYGFTKPNQIISAWIKTKFVVCIGLSFLDFTAGFITCQ